MRSMMVDVCMSSSDSVPKVLLVVEFDAPINHLGADSMASVSDTQTVHASTVSQARVVDHSMIGTQARVANFRITRAVLGSQARVVDTQIIHALTVSQARYWTL